MDSVLSEGGVKMGGQVELTLGPFGRAGKFDVDLSTRGVGATVSVAYSKGAFLGLSIEGGVVGARAAVNNYFYGKDLPPRQIVLDDMVDFPADKVTMIDEVYEKLKKLSEGATAEPAADEEAKKQQALAQAEKEASVRNQEAGVVHVDSSKEAAK